MIALTPELRAEYQRLFDACEERPERRAEALAAADRLLAARPRYEAVGQVLSIPWDFIAVIHAMESGQRFDRHLHNGDPLTACTVCVPAGRPPVGGPPFTWEASAADALQLEKLDHLADWSLPALLYRVEKYNGFGYRMRQVPSPYLWAGSTHYESGKFVADGKFDPAAVSRQLGAAVLLGRLRA